jgi:cytochrome b561
MPGDGDTLDQVAVLDGRPVWRRVWRRVWPTPPETPDHGMLERWMAKPGHALLAGSTTS